MAPEIGPVTPATGHGRTQTFRFEASYPGGAEAINDLGIIFTDALTSNPARACQIDVASNLTTVAVRTNDGTVWQPAIAVGAQGTVTNDNCSVAANQVKVERHGNQLVVTVPVVFNDGLKGDVRVWAIGSGPAKHSGWQERGTWTVE